MRKILLRFDDFNSRMDWQQWERANSVIEKYNIKPLIGIVPDCKDPNIIRTEHKDNYWDYVRELAEKGYSLALHGCFHLYTTDSKGILGVSKNSEFAGLSFDEQLSLVKHGITILNENRIDTNVFFAPAHSFDKNTIKALKSLGFKYISDGKSLKAYSEYGIKHLPCRSGGVPRHFGQNGFYTVVFHTNEWIDDKKNDLDKLEWLCENCRDDIVGFDEFCSIPEGNFWIQKIVEKIIVFSQRHIIPVLVRIKHIASAL